MVGSRADFSIGSNHWISVHKMVFLSKALVAAACASSALAVDVIVQSQGGNVTGKFGHPYGYGFLHEVSAHTIFIETTFTDRSLGYQQLRRRWYLRRVDPESCIPVQQRVQCFHGTLLPCQQSRPQHPISR